MSGHVYTLNGKRVPGVTTVIDGLGWNKQALLYWANKCGREGASLDVARDESLSDGLHAHRWIEHTLRGAADWDMDIFEKNSGVGRAFDGWVKWYKKRTMLGAIIEEPITCAELRCGGRPDLIATESSRVCVYDWKTYDGKDGKKDPYAEYWVQLAAYAEMYRVETGRIIDDLVVVMLNKTTGEADEYRLPVLSDKADAALAAFKHARALYDLRKTLTKKEEGWE